jgi:hypothetical protein
MFSPFLTEETTLVILSLLTYNDNFQNISKDRTSEPRKYKLFLDEYDEI